MLDKTKINLLQDREPSKFFKSKQSSHKTTKPIMKDLKMIVSLVIEAFKEIKSALDRDAEALFFNENAQNIMRLINLEH